MKRRIDKLTVVALIFDLWYLLTASIYILQYYAGIRLVTLVGESIAYPIMLIATLGGIFSGEAHSIIIAWSPIAAIIIGFLGWLSDEKGKYFILIPCICLVAPLLMFLIPAGTSIFGILYLAMPIVSIVALLAWVITDICIKKIEV